MGGKQKGISEMSTQTMREGFHGRDGIEGRGGRDQAEAGAKEAPFEYELRTAIEADRIADARTLVANAEAVLSAHGATEGASSERMTQAQLAAAKARIAIATGDGAAARAILVRAIERNPKAPALKALMTEAMMAAGRASDVRPVLQHLGNSPAIGQDPSSDVVPPPPTMRDTSG